MTDQNFDSWKKIVTNIKALKPIKYVVEVYCGLYNKCLHLRYKAIKT